MRSKPLAIAVFVIVVLSAIGFAIVRSQLPMLGASMLLYPARRVSHHVTPAECVDRVFEGINARLAGWVCVAASGASKPSIVYLHGIGDNRDSSIGVIDRFLRRGFSVLAYDSRGHGRSEGDKCTYGFYEKHDLSRVLDQTGINRAIVIGHSLGGAVALQAAAIDGRIEAVISASTFADLRSIATDRAPFVFTPALIDAAFARAENDAGFAVAEVSPLRAAATLTIPVFIIHGALDGNTPPIHSQRVYDAIRGPRKLLLVPGVGHNDALRGDVWVEIEKWIDSLLL